MFHRTEPMSTAVQERIGSKAKRQTFTRRLIHTLHPLLRGTPTIVRCGGLCLCLCLCLNDKGSLGVGTQFKKLGGSNIVLLDGAS